MISECRPVCLLQIVAASALVLLPCAGQAGQEAARPAATPAVSGIQFTFKRDPRAVDPTRGIGPWVAGPNYVGSYAQQTVEVRVEGVDVAGRPTKISPQWIPSDPDMVTVSPSKGDDVTIAVHRAGESKLKITYQGFSTELMVKARVVGQFLLFEITEVPATKPTAPAASLPTASRSKNDVSYAAGVNLAKALQEQSVEVDLDSLIQGVKDTLSGGRPRMSEELVAAVLEGLQTDQRMVRANVTREALAEKNKREGEAFLAENKKKEGVVNLPSGLQYRIIKMGEGKRPTANDLVECGYRATFINGTEFGNSYKQSASVTFPVKSVIKGWAEALQLMPVGSKWQLFVPPELAYGDRGASGGGGRKAGPAHQIVGPNATLIFDLELLGIQELGAKPPASSSTDEKNVPTSEMMDAIKKAIEAEAQAEKKPEKPQKKETDQ